MKQPAIFLLFIFLSATTFSQENSCCKTDEQGRKQGYWKKSDENGKLIYEGYFKNDKPLDTMKRYFENGNLKALMIYSEKHDTIRSYMYFEEGGLSAEGKYFNKMKIELWKYYSAYFNCVIQEDYYLMGQKHGISINYYQNGTKSEQLEFEKGIRNGKWIQYFEDGKMKFEAYYVNDRLNGEYRLYQPDERVEIEGNYKDDLKDGLWRYYDEKGNLYKEIMYHQGVAENEKELKQIQQKYFDIIEQNKGKYQEPDGPGSGY